MAPSERWRKNSRPAVVPAQFAAAEEAVLLLAQHVSMDDGIQEALVVDAIFRLDSARIPREDAVDKVLGLLRPLMPGIDRQTIEQCLEEAENVDPKVVAEFDRIRSEL